MIHADAARELGYQHDPSKGDENDGPSTRGTVVRGLTLKDVLALDTFEGDVSDLSLGPTWNGTSNE